MKISGSMRQIYQLWAATSNPNVARIWGSSCGFLEEWTQRGGLPYVCDEGVSRKTLGVTQIMQAGNFRAKEQDQRQGQWS